jgi:hypothetical protein
MTKPHKRCSLFYYLLLYYSRLLHVENLYCCSYLAFALVIGLTIAIRIGNATARSSAVFIEGKSKAKTLGIGIY